MNSALIWIREKHQDKWLASVIALDYCNNLKVKVSNELVVVNAQESFIPLSDKTLGFQNKWSTEVNLEVMELSEGCILVAGLVNGKPSDISQSPIELQVYSAHRLGDAITEQQAISFIDHACPVFKLSKYPNEFDFSNRNKISDLNLADIGTLKLHVKEITSRNQKNEAIILALPVRGKLSCIILASNGPWFYYQTVLVGNCDNHKMNICDRDAGIPMDIFKKPGFYLFENGKSWACRDDDEWDEGINGSVIPLSEQHLSRFDLNQSDLVELAREYIEDESNGANLKDYLVSIDAFPQWLADIPDNQTLAIQP